MQTYYTMSWRTERIKKLRGEGHREIQSLPLESPHLHSRQSGSFKKHKHPHKSRTAFFSDNEHCSFAPITLHSSGREVQQDSALAAWESFLLIIPELGT